VERLDAKKSETAAKPAAPVEAKPTKIALLDGKRAMNTAIAIARVKMSYSEIRDSVLTLREGSLSEEQMTQLLEFMPTADEESTLKEFRCVTKPLSFAHCTNVNCAALALELSCVRWPLHTGATAQL
jgi:Formin Homology 2 Domain